MKEHNMTLRHLAIDSTWSCFLDRDGVINRKLPGDYVKSWDEFDFLQGVPEAISTLSGIFGKIFIATNQQGIGKGLMTERDLDVLHNTMLEEIRYAGGKVHKIYYSPYKAEEKSVFRKPGIGMARKAKIDFPEIDFARSIMVGDSLSDMQFGKGAGMYTVFITPGNELSEELKPWVDFQFPSLSSFVAELTGSEATGH